MTHTPPLPKGNFHPNLGLLGFIACLVLLITVLGAGQMLTKYSNALRRKLHRSHTRRWVQLCTRSMMEVTLAMSTVCKLTDQELQIMQICALLGLPPPSCNWGPLLKKLSAKARERVLKTHMKDQWVWAQECSPWRGGSRGIHVLASLSSLPEQFVGWCLGVCEVIIRKVCVAQHSTFLWVVHWVKFTYHHALYLRATKRTQVVV